MKVAVGQRWYRDSGVIAEIEKVENNEVVYLRVIRSTAYFESGKLLKRDIQCLDKTIGWGWHYFSGQDKPSK